MPGAEPELPGALQGILASLAAELHHAGWGVSIEPDAFRTRLVGDRFEVPVKYEIHWRRFGTIPTELVRDMAYLARSRPGAAGDEADHQAFAQAFIRDHVLGDTEIERPD